MTATSTQPAQVSLRVRKPVMTVSAKEERTAWRDARAHMSALMNILLSMGAIATAVWWGAGSASTLWKVSVALGLSLLIGTAEVVLYARYARVMRVRATTRRHPSNAQGTISRTRPTSQAVDKQVTNT